MASQTISPRTEVFVDPDSPTMVNIKDLIEDRRVEIEYKVLNKLIVGLRHSVVSQSRHYRMEVDEEENIITLRGQDGSQVYYFDMMEWEMVKQFAERIRRGN